MCAIGTNTPCPILCADNVGIQFNFNTSATEALREACAKAARYCDEQGYPIDKLAIQYSTSCNDHIATTLFSSANPKNVLKNIEYVNEPIDWQLVKKVQEIIGDQMGVRWKNS